MLYIWHHEPLFTREVETLNKFTASLTPTVFFKPNAELQLPGFTVFSTSTDMRAWGGFSSPYRLCGWINKVLFAPWCVVRDYRLAKCPSKGDGINKVGPTCIMQDSSAVSTRVVPTLFGIKHWGGWAQLVPFLWVSELRVFVSLFLKLYRYFICAHICIYMYTHMYMCVHKFHNWEKKKQHTKQQAKMLAGLKNSTHSQDSEWKWSLF